MRSTPDYTSGKFILLLILACARCTTAYALTEAVNISPQSGTHSVDATVSLSAFVSPGIADSFKPNEPPCCGAEEATWVFKEFEITSWSGHVVNASGASAELDTSTEGSKSVTANATITWRCTATDATTTTTGYGTASFEVNDEFKANMSPVGDVYVFREESVDFQSSPSGGTESFTYDWTFEGGSPDSSTSQSQTVTYNTLGEYAVDLEVKDSSDPQKVATDTATVYVVELDHQTQMAAADEVTPNTRTTIGMGEYVDLKILPEAVSASIDWSIDEGEGELSNLTGPTTILMSGPAGQIVVSAKVAGAASPATTFTVVPPTGNDCRSKTPWSYAQAYQSVYGTPPPASPDPATVPGSGMTCWLRVLPANVNFSKLMLGEGSCSATNGTGIYAAPWNKTHPSWGPRAPNAQSRWNDPVAHYDPAATANGAYDWVIPFRYWDDDSVSWVQVNTNTHHATVVASPPGGSVSKWGESQP